MSTSWNWRELRGRAYGVRGVRHNLRGRIFRVRGGYRLLCAWPAVDELPDLVASRQPLHPFRVRGGGVGDFSQGVALGFGMAGFQPAACRNHPEGVQLHSQGRSPCTGNRVTRSAAPQRGAIP